MVDRTLAILDTSVKLPSPGPHDVFGVRPTERDEQQAGLIDVLVVGINHGDRRFRGAEKLPEPIRGQGAAGSTAKNQNSCCHRRPSWPSRNWRHRGRSHTSVAACDRLAA